MIKQNYFIGITLPEKARRDFQEFLKAQAVVLPGKATPPIKWHITLLFLGEISKSQAHNFAETLRKKVPQPLSNKFQIELGALGAFPQGQWSRIIWAGIDRGTKELASLSADLASIARSLGLSPDDRPYIPHVTLSRLKQPQPPETILPSLLSGSISFEASQMALFRSIPSKELPYELVKTFPFGPA